MWNVLNSNVGLLVVGFVLTGLVGAMLNSRIQSVAWQRQKKHELLVSTLAEGDELFKQLTEILSKRVFGLLTVFWAIEEAKPDEDVDAAWEEYYSCVKVWNGKLQFLRFKIETIAGKELADKFLNFDDDANSLNPSSIHYQIRQAHLAVRRLRMAPHKADAKELADQASKLLDRLQRNVEIFSHEIAGSLLYSEKTLKQQVK